MSLSNTTVGATYACNGVTTNFAIPFAFISNDQIKVYKITVLDGTQVLQTLTTDYTLFPVIGIPTAIKMNVAPAADYRIRVERATPITQETDYINAGGFLAEDHEEALDKLTQVVQEINMVQQNSLQLSKIDYGNVSAKLDKIIPDSVLVVSPTGDRIEMGPTLTSMLSDVGLVTGASDDAI